MKQITFNINDEVRIKLTELGEKLYTEKYSKHYFAKKDENGYIEIQLWQVMSIFGPHMYNSGDLPFETDIIIPIL